MFSARALAARKRRRQPFSPALDIRLPLVTNYLPCLKATTNETSQGGRWISARAVADGFAPSAQAAGLAN
jgi:hypothetical protein